jgi:hypothetical protein
MRSPIHENIAALARSVVGRTPDLGTLRRKPPALPDMIRIGRNLARTPAARKRESRDWNCSSHSGGFFPSRAFFLAFPGAGP